MVLAGIGFFRCRKTWIVDSTNLAISVVAGMPLTALAIVVYEPLWDDMTHWLVSAQFLFRQSHLPTAVEPIINSSHAIYPYARAMLHAWVNSVNGNFTVNVQGNLQLFVLSSTFHGCRSGLKSRGLGLSTKEKYLSHRRREPVGFSLGCDAWCNTCCQFLCGSGLCHMFPPYFCFGDSN